MKFVLTIKSLIINEMRWDLHDSVVFSKYFKNGINSD